MRGARQYEILPTRRVAHGLGALEAIPELLEQAGVRRVALLTSPSVARTALLPALEGLCGTRLATVFSLARPHNPVSTVMAAASAVRGAGADAVVTLGGGSATDLGKAVRLVLRHGAQTAEAFLRLATRKGAVPPVALAPQPEPPGVPLHVAVPTTLAGAEFGHSCAVTDDATHLKHLFIYGENAPAVIVLDPQACAETPAALWTSTGVKAVDHAVEQLYAVARTPFTDPLCLAGLGALHRHLPDVDDAAARLACLEATWLICFGMMNVMKGLSHGLGHQIGARWQVPHGFTSCVTMPHVLRFNRPYALEAERRMAEAIGLPVAGRSDEAAAAALAEALQAWIAGMGLPTRLRDVGADPEDFPAVARAAIRDPITIANPRPLDDPDAVEGLLRDAW